MKNPEELNQKDAYLYIIKLLTKRDYSKYKLTQKLQAKGFSENDIESAIIDVEQKGYIREKQYATARAKALMLKGNHPRFIIDKLEQEHLAINLQEVMAVFEEHNITISSQIDSLIQKKLSPILGNEDQENISKFKQKIIRYVLSKGHELDQLTEQLNSILDNQFSNSH